MAMGTNNYSNSLEETMNIMKTHQQAKLISNVRQGNKQSNTKLTFAQKGEDKYKRDLLKIICYNGGEQSHNACTCSKKKGKSNED